MGVHVLGAVGLLTTPMVGGLLAVIVLAAAFALRHHPLAWRRAVSGETVPLLLVAAVALAIVITAAYLLPVWHTTRCAIICRT